MPCIWVASDSFFYSLDKILKILFPLTIIILLTDNNYRLKNYCDYPIQIYGKGVQFLLTFVIPYAFTGYYPIAKLLEKEVPWPDICYLGPVVALLFGGIAYVLWCTGIKRYNGAGV